MKITLSPDELCVAIGKHYPALAGHMITNVSIKTEYNNALAAVEITMEPVAQPKEGKQ